MLNKGVAYISEIEGAKKLKSSQINKPDKKLPILEI